ncbi:MAG: aminotransferase class V-fold PLP-dependent enzyme, partial [Planctomycetota bacterium]|nr:aminotransferase class V-fold PLP-dependent enzyme [Planctomycetota bacterium]
MSNQSAIASNWTLDPRVHFLNHGSFGAVLAEVQEIQQDYRDRLEREPVDFFLRALPPLFDEARDRVADFLGADPDGLVFTSNATAGVNAVLRSMRFEPGDELLCTNHGYNACQNVLQFVAERWGAKVVVAQIPFPLDSEDQVVEAIESAVTPRTKIALIDHVTSPTGLVLPIERILEIMEAKGIDTIVDGAHGPGMLPLELKKLGAPYYVANGHKWLCAPKTVGMLYVREDRRDRVTPAIISHGANSPRGGYPQIQTEFDWPGTVDPTPVLCLPKSIEAMAQLLPGGWDGIYAANQAMALRGRDLLCEALGIQTPAPDSMIGNLAAAPLPELDPDVPTGPFTPDPLHRALWENHRVEIPVFNYPGEPSRLIRLSAQLYNRIENYEAMAAGLR